MICTAPAVICLSTYQEIVDNPCSIVGTCIGLIYDKSPPKLLSMTSASQSTSFGLIAEVDLLCNIYLHLILQTIDIEMRDILMCSRCPRNCLLMQLCGA